MKVNDLFEEWNNDPVKDEDYYDKLNKKIYALRSEVEMWQEHLRTHPMKGGQVEFLRHERVMQKIRQIQLELQRNENLEKNARKKFKYLRHDPHEAYQYARGVRRGEFKEGEPAIAKNGHLALLYALDVAHKRFPEGEEQMKAFFRKSEVEDSSADYENAKDLIVRYQNKYKVKLIGKLS